MVWKIREVGEGEEQKIVVELDGVVDSTNVEQFFAFISSVFKRDINRIVLDMEYTGFLSSGGISVIIDAYNKAEDLGGKLVIARASDMVRDLFEVVQFNKIIEFYESIEEALGSF